MNSNSVFRFSGLGDVTNMLEYPKPTAVAKARPKAADFPRPLAAVIATVLRSVFSDMASTNFKRAFAWKPIFEIIYICKLK